MFDANEKIIVLYKIFTFAHEFSLNFKIHASDPTRIEYKMHSSRKIPITCNDPNRQNELLTSKMYENPIPEFS